MSLDSPDIQPPEVSQNAQVLSNEQVACGTYRIRIHAPKIAARILPGQFVMLRIGGRHDPLLARPFAMYDTILGTDGSAEAIEVVYLVMGEGTRCLRQLGAGDYLHIWGPLGNTFPVSLTASQNRHLLIVAGGIGQTPLLSVIRELQGQRSFGNGREVVPPGKITFAWGVRSADSLMGLDDFHATGATVRVATEDGSAGYHGLVTDLVQQEMQSSEPPTAIFGCGPEPMLESLCGRARDGGIPCWVSLEVKMACGYGVCFGCVCRIRKGDGWDYRRVCVEGPVFPAEEICWTSEA